MCIYSDFSHAELRETAFLESCTPQEVLLRMLFLRLEDSGSDEKLISPYCKDCKSSSITEQLCRRSIVCHNVVDAAGKKTGEKMLCRDCTKWLQPWLGMTREKAEAAEFHRQLHFLPDIQPGEANLSQDPPTSSGDRGEKRNSNSLFPIPYRPDEWFADEVRLTDNSATLTPPSAGSRPTNDAARHRNDGNPRQLKRARVMPRGSHNVRSLTGFDARHGIGRRLSNPRSERPGPNVPRVQLVPGATRGRSGHPALFSDSYRSPRDSLPRNTKGRVSTSIKQEPTAVEASAEAPGLDRVCDDGKDKSLPFKNQTPRSKPSDNPAVDQPLQSAHRSLLSVANAQSNLQGATTRDQKSVDIDDELTYAIRDGSFKRATEAQFRRKSLSPDALMEEVVKNRIRIIPTLKLRGGTADAHTSSATSASLSVQPQPITVAPATWPSISAGSHHQRPRASPTRSSTQPRYELPTAALSSTAATSSREQEKDETIHRLRVRLYKETDRRAKVEQQLAEDRTAHAETLAELAEVRRNEAGL